MADYFFAPVADVFTPIAAELELYTGLKSYFLEQSKNHALDRWDWQPTQGTGGLVDMTGGINRPLTQIEFRCEIACRAKTHDNAWYMAQQFLTATRKVKAASARLESWTVSPSSDQAATLKNVIVLTMVWTMPLLEQDLEKSTSLAPIAHVQFDTSDPQYGVDDDTLIAPLG